MRPRRFLPSLSLLTAFEAVVRHGSVTDAAAELSLTQSTVSRLVAQLEAQLGVALFTRARRRLIPTEAARAYAAEVARGLDMIQSAGMRAVANPQGGQLSLSVLPTFGLRWLAPRLPAFLETNPGVSVDLATRSTRFSFDLEPFDAVIFFGRDDWPMARHMKLFDEQLTACAAPDYLARHPVPDPQALARHPLLHLVSRPQAWADWFAAHGAEPAGPGGMRLDQFSIMVQSAISGLGVALLPDYLAESEIAEGRLTALFTRRVRASGAYWLAWPETRDRHPPLIALRGWLAQTCAAD